MGCFFKNIVQGYVQKISHSYCCMPVFTAASEKTSAPSWMQRATRIWHHYVYSTICFIFLSWTLLMPFSIFHCPGDSISYIWCPCIVIPAFPYHCCPQTYDPSLNWQNSVSYQLVSTSCYWYLKALKLSHS